MRSVKHGEGGRLSMGNGAAFSTRPQQVELAALVERFTGLDGIHPTAVSSLFLTRFSKPNERLAGILRPALCIAAQGSKQIMLAEDIFPYDPDHHMVVTVDLPLVGRILEASPKTPYLGIQLDLDPGQIGPLIAETHLPTPEDQGKGRGIYITRSSYSLLDAMIRLVRLLESPQDIPTLAPLIQREILYRLLLSEQSRHLHRIAMANSQTQQIAKAIQWVKQNYNQPLRIDEISRAVNMSVSGLHHWFKTVTAMSPLQYQKQLRLQEARRLMMTHVVGAATAGFQVGYESPSQFSREYRRLFGAPPARDMARLRNAS
ncbi:MAG TPA: AraC family transcriptional regulator [Candidatus Solibacter sp.]|nr:AraC family transcriptional regulator [Candidatus Solibacter sp.]